MYKQTLCRFGSIHDAQFVDEVRGTGILLDDEERVADVHAGGALRRGAEGDVARQAFVVAVEEAVPMSSPRALNTGLPEFPPVLSVSTMKHTGIRPSSRA